MKNYIGIDNGVTGSIGIIPFNGKKEFHHTPARMSQNYQKKSKSISRIDIKQLKAILEPFASNSFALLERPLTAMIGKRKLDTIISGMRALEATLIVLEDLSIPYQFIDSKSWQKELLPVLPPKTPNASSRLKALSLDIGKRLFPEIDFKGFKDADGLMIAEYARRKNL
jgi:hypothetical protein